MTLKIVTDKDIFSQPEFIQPKKYQKRITVKAVVINDKGKFGFVTNKIHNFILLAGGGAESENLEKEIDRECQEEIFYSLKKIKKINQVQEFRNKNAKEYETICFFAQTNKKIIADNRTDDEKKNGLRVVWFNKNEVINILKKQVEKVKKGEVNFYNTAFDIVRDSMFFNEYLKQGN